MTTTTIGLADLGSPSGDNLTFKDTPVGTTYEGLIVHLDEWEGETDGRKRKCVIVSLEKDGEVGKLWIDHGKQMMTAVTDGVRAANAEGLSVGGYLAVKFKEEKEVGKPQPQKIYVSQYKAGAAPAATAEPDTSAVDDLF